MLDTRTVVAGGSMEKMRGKSVKTLPLFALATVDKNRTSECIKLSGRSWFPVLLNVHHQMKSYWGKHKFFQENSPSASFADQL